MMDALLVSPVARALGLALLHFLWQGVVIGALAAFILRRARDAGPSTRYAVACAGLLAMLAAPIATAFWLLGGATVATVPGGWADAVTGAATIDISASGSTLDRLLPIIVLGWAAGVFALALHLASGWLDVRRLRRSGTRLAAGWQDHAAALAGRLGVARVVTVLQSSHVAVPTVIGWLRPAILLPASAFAGLTPSQLDAIITHELAHVRRHDYLVNVFQSAVETLLFYHPAVWWVSNQLRLEREHCCDDEAVRACGDRVSYARALASLEERRSQALALGMAADGGQLLGRVRRLLGATPVDEPRAAGWSALAVATTVVPLLLVAGMAGAIEIPAEDAAAPDTSSAAAPIEQVSGPVRVGGGIQPPEKIWDVTPVYPEMAREAKVQGIVIMEAVISGSGDVENARVLRGNPMLDDAALDAVRQWKYTPPLLNGQPVSVIMTVTVKFALNDGGPDGSASPTQSGVPPPPPPDGAATQQTSSFPDATVRVGGGVAAPRKVFDAAPVYPDAARAAGVEGIVIIEAVISGSGDVENARVLRGNPMLDPAALDAVRQWKYMAPLLNGQPVSVIMTVTVNFRLNDGGPDGSASPTQSGFPPPPPAEGAATLQTSSFPDDIVRAGGGIPAPRKIFDAAPVYPEAARAAGIQGIVIAEVLIDSSGNVTDIRILRANPLLEDAAVDAIWQWRYEPVLLNGNAVPMVLTVTVNFTLGNDALD